MFAIGIIALSVVIVVCIVVLLIARIGEHIDHQRTDE